MAEIEVEPRLLDDVRDFIDEKWKHSECELCGTDRWAIYPDPYPYAYLVAAGEKGILQAFEHKTLPYLPASCTNCGNLRLIDARIFEKWREAKRAGRTKSSS
ncbi:MAG TPA: hypothetical protein VFQ90_19460 [Stellaceae bacterium]|jgi:hypothetical protein|nr:hypothetical protein [Stellaceae bacterium]